jgi:hypothetical protein
MKKRIFAAILAAAMALSCAVSASAQTSDEIAAESIEAQIAAEQFADTAAAAEAVEIAQTSTEAPTEPATEAPTEAPAAIPEIVSANAGADGLTIKWTAYDGAAKYRLFMKSGGRWKLVADTAALSYTHTGLGAGTEIVYTVRAMDRNNQYISGYNKAGYTARYLAAPELGAVTNVYEGQKIVWNASKGAARYRVFVRDGSAWKSIGTTAENSFVYTKAVSGTSYSYTVRCMSADGKVYESWYDRKGVARGYVASPKISGFAPVNNGTKISWGAVAGAEKYRVFALTKSGWKKIADTASTSVNHTGLSGGVTYIYTVRAMNSADKYLSGYNPEGWERTYYDAPAIGEIGYEDGAYTVTIVPQGRVYGYRVYRRTFGEAWTALGITEETSYRDESAEEDILYSYTVRSIDENEKNISYYTDTGLYYIGGELADGDFAYHDTTVHFIDGRIRKGYLTVDGLMYYYNANGQIMKNTIVGSKAEGYTYADKNGVCCVSEEIKLAANFMMVHGTGKTLEERMKTSFLYMAKHCPYNRTYDHPKTAEDLAPLAIDLFRNEKGNCFRYAAAFTCIAKIAGYRTRTVIGATATYMSPHGWTEVLVDGKWLICDVDAQLPKYRQPDYRPYMMEEHYWPLVANVKCEFIIDETGHAYWK